MPSDSLTLHLTPHSPTALIATLTGEAGQPQEKQLDKLAADLAARPEPLLILDLAGLTFISSVGLRTLLSIKHHKRSANHTLVLAAVPEPILSVLKRCKLDTQFPTYPTPTAALAAHDDGPH